MLLISQFHLLRYWALLQKIKCISQQFYYAHNVDRRGMLPFQSEQRTLNQSPLDTDKILSGCFWGELRVFLAVAKAKSFNRAAEILNTSQPTVSRQVRRLQDLMGSQLFVPTQQGVKLTQKVKSLQRP
jgi:Bacterial regulatory helix-turn-helix protein, lysR family